MKRKPKVIVTKADNPPKPQLQLFWCVMKAHAWNNLSVGGMALTSPESGPCRFIPIFDTREKAIAWDNGSDEFVREMFTP